MVKDHAGPISMDSGIAEIRDIAMADDFHIAEAKGTVEKIDFLEAYTLKNISFADKDKVKPLKVLVNPNFGAAGPAIEKIADYYGLELTKLNFEPDGTFPKGKPDHSQPSNRVETTELMKSGDFDLGVTWDADADRCGFYDEKGNYIFPYYSSGLMIDYFLAKEPGAKIVVDSCYYWLPEALVERTGGEVVISRTGYSYVTQAMIDNNALFGAEIAGHYYFKDYWLADSGMIPFVIMLQILSQSDKPFSQLLQKYEQIVYAEPVVNFTVTNVLDTIARVKEEYSDGKISELDGFATEYADWRFNVRGSNTEPLLRLSLEAKTQELANEKLVELTEVINGS
jgi:phosphomannomutase